MKQRLLSFAVIATLALTAFAQTTWTPPALDESLGVELKSSSTDTVYLYNVGAAQFLIGGTDWGTHAALGTNGLPIRLTSNAEDAWTVYFFEGSKSQQILGRSTEADLFIDYNNNNGWCTTFTFTKVGNYYRIQSNVNDETFGQEAYPGTYIGQVPTREDIDHNNNSLGFGAGVYGNVTLDEPDAHVDWLIISKENYKAYNELVTVKQQLLSLINTAEENDVPVDNFVSKVREWVALMRVLEHIEPSVNWVFYLVCGFIELRQTYNNILIFRENSFNGYKQRKMHVRYSSTKPPQNRPKQQDSIHFSIFFQSQIA